MNNIYSKNGLLFLVQVDHLSGELLGSAIEYLYAAGARNVQILPSVTKKNRPGQSIIIDASDSRAVDIERVIVEELGSTGWHRFVTEHRHLPVELISKRIKVETSNGPLDFEISGKMIKNQPESVRPEHASCLAFQRALKERAGLEAPLGEIYLKAANALRATSTDEVFIYFKQTDGG